jgi:hypothetical protein
MQPLRAYLDASVIGGCLDEEFREPSKALVGMIRRGEVVALVSDLLVQELSGAPEEVRAVLASLPRDSVEALQSGGAGEVEALARAYIEAGVLGEAHFRDALHVALATAANADMIVSWNFRHIVHHEKIRGFRAVNLLKGCLPIGVFSPPEVI